MQKAVYNGEPLNCECGKLYAIKRNGKIYIKCKRCSREIEVRFVNDTKYKGIKP